VKFYGVPEFFVVILYFFAKCNAIYSSLNLEQTFCQKYASDKTISIQY